MLHGHQLMVQSKKTIFCLANGGYAKLNCISLKWPLLNLLCR